MPITQVSKSKIPTIKKRKDFLVARSKGQSVAYGGIAIQALYKKPASEDLTNLEQSKFDQGIKIRFGFTATKRTIGNAVNRNRARRRLKAIVQIILKETDIISNSFKSIDYVIIARQSIVKRSFEELFKDCMRAFKKLQSNLTAH